LTFNSNKVNRLMKNFLIIFCFVFLSSCQLFDKKVPDEQDLLQQELQKINWKEVDAYPTVASCESINDKEVQKQCFFDYLTQLIQQRISIDTLHILYPEIDTISVKVTIQPDATVAFETLKPEETVSYDIAVIDSILQNRLSDFPKIEPAIKRGIKVKSQFVLPVIIKVEE
jgi:hypothetical protein